MDDVPGEPGLPIVEGDGVERLGHGREIARLPDDDLGEGRLGAAECGRPGRPVEAGGKLGQGRLVHLVVGESVVPALDAVPVPLGEPGVERHDPVGLRLRIGHTGQLEHPCHVGNVGLADLGELRVAIVRLVRQADAALVQVDDVAVRPLGVGVDRGADRPLDALALEGAERTDQVGLGADRRGLVEVRPDRLEAEPVGGRLVQEARVEVADLSRHGAGRVVGFRRLLDDGAEVGLGLIAEFVEGAVERPIRRDGRLGEPLAIDVAEQVVLRPDLGQEIGAIDA